jgi:F0F1-type ATP synthase assembly protein I
LDNTLGVLWSIGESRKERLVADASFFARMGKLSAIVTILPASMAGGWIAGYIVVDRPFATSPWGGIVGTLLGAGAGFYEIIRILTSEQQRRGQDRGKKN